MALVYLPALTNLQLVAEPVARWLEQSQSTLDVAAIDPDVADTAACCERYGLSLDDSANCVVIAGKLRSSVGTAGDDVRFAACVLLATMRADVNGAVRKHLDVRKASFAQMDEAVAKSGMEYGGITPFGLPPEWPVLIDARVIERERAVFGSGLRASKLFGPGRSLLDLPNAVCSDFAKSSS